MSSNPFQQNATQSNMTLPDQLAEIRKIIKGLKKDEEQLVAEIKEIGDCVGQSFEAQVVTEKRRSMKTDDVKKHLGDRLDEFYEEKEITKIKLKECGK
tara:strand:- start:805 stop:1098 length:294 start_codon:yes stop_codon:yes gene_type:complete